MALPHARRPGIALVLLASLAASALVFARRPAQAVDPGAGVEPIVVPFLVDAVRVPGPVDGRLLVVNRNRDGAPIEIEAVSVLHGGAELWSESRSERLVGDPRYVELNAMIERMPEEVTELHRERRFFAPEDAPLYAGVEVVDRWQEIVELGHLLREDYESPAARPFAELTVPIDLALLFAPGDPVGSDRELVFRAEYRDRDGSPRTVESATTVRLLPPFSRPAGSLALGSGSFDIHAGDLHVHSCHGEAVNACAPSADCAAESFQTSGSFLYSELKTGFQNLGLDWFAAADHSYCIQSDAEYDFIVNETAALTDASFLVMPDIELSSDEVGAQIGSDSGDLACLGTTQANHMGAHGITSRKEGGSAGFQGFCDGLFGGDALDDFLSNVAAVRAENGYPIVHHPTGSFGWNSFDATDGIEENQMHGVEIWNGAFVSGQGGDVGQWVDWLLGGRVLYAYSGSDTHDAAFDFGANQVLLPAGAPLNESGIVRAVKRGFCFISNQHMLVIEVDQQGLPLPMGTIQGLTPSAGADSLSIDVAYDFGADTGTIQVYRGVEGDGSETLLCQSGALTGSGTFPCLDVLGTGSNSWYRAYSLNGAGDRAAYTNPVFFTPGTCSYTSYGSGLGGANVGTLACAQSPSIGSVNRFELSGFSGSSSVRLFFSTGQIPAGTPFFGGFALLSSPKKGVDVALSGGAGSFDFAVPLAPGLVGQTIYLQAGGADPGQSQGIAFSNGLVMTFCGVGQ